MTTVEITATIMIGVEDIDLDLVVVDYSLLRIRKAAWGQAMVSFNGISTKVMLPGWNRIYGQSLMQLPTNATKRLQVTYIGAC